MWKYTTTIMHIIVSNDISEKLLFHFLFYFLIVKERKKDSKRRKIVLGIKKKQGMKIIIHKNLEYLHHLKVSCA